jgi:hypothetical protein
MSKLRFALAGLLSLFVVASAAAQPVTMPSNTVWGRSGIGSGPGAAIPFANLLPQMFAALGVNNGILTTNSGGQLVIEPFSTACVNFTSTAPGCVPLSGGGTAKFLRADGTFATPSTFTSSAAGYVPASGGGTTNFLRADGSFAVPTLTTTASSVDNFLPNVQWQLFSSLSFITKYNSLGTGTQAAATCASFQTANGQPQFTCSNTSQIKVGDLVYVTIVSGGSTNFWVFPNGAGTLTCSNVQCGFGGLVTSARVVNVVANTSITIQPPFGAISAGSSSATTLTPIAPGDLGSLPRGPDGWTKTASLILTVDDFTTNAYPGAYRPMLLVKGITGEETVCWNAPSGGAITGGNGSLAAFQGRAVSFGAAVYQKIQGGANTWNLYIADSAGTTFSNNGTGSSFGGYQFLTATRTISSTTTIVSICINTNGNAGDAYYVALPTAAFTSSLTQAQIHQNSHEIIRAQNHWNPPLTTPMGIPFSSSVLVTGCGCYGWNSIDLEVISNGQVHKSVSRVMLKAEWGTSTVGAQIFTGNNSNGSWYTFGPQVITQVASVTNASGPSWLPINFDGTFTINGNTSGLSGENLTLDFTDVDASMPTSVN